MTQAKTLKGLILSGGNGTRLRPFTFSTPKQLLPIGNKPVLFYVIESLVEAGINEIGVVVGAMASQIEEAAGDGSRFGARLEYIPQDEPRGLAHAVQIARPFLGDDPFAVFLGDNFLRGGVRRYVEDFAASDEDGRILLKEVPNPADFGVAVVGGGGRLERLLEKPVDPPSNLAILGVYLLRRGFFEAVEQIRPSGRGELEITDALQKMIESSRDLRGRTISDDWIDTGTAEDMLRANRLVLEDIASCSEGVSFESAQVETSRIEQPCLIGTGSRIVDSEIGAGVSIGANCQINAARVVNSIVMEGANIEGAELCDSIVGRNARIRGRRGSPLRVLLGDYGRLELV